MDIYGISKMKSVDFERGRVVDSNNAIMIIAYELGARRLTMIGGGPDSLGAQYRGYIEVGKAFIAPYSGKYGNGFICCTHNARSSRYMDVCYYIPKED